MINFEAAPASLQLSLFGVVARTGGRTVDMARIVGDGAIDHDLQDVVVHPNHQRRGLGRRLLRTVVDRVRSVAPSRTFFGVFAVRGTEVFNGGLGFGRRHELTGMFQVVAAGDRGAYARSEVP